MPLETSNSIAGLVATWPLSGDFVSEGDNHLNLIKSVLKQQFPGANGQGFETPILATEAEINYLQGARANIQSQIDNITTGGGTELIAPPGTVMIFFQGSPPFGWTQKTSNNDAMLRVVSSAGGGSGGAGSPISHSHATSGYAIQMHNLPTNLGDSINILVAPSTQSDDHNQSGTVSKGSTGGSETQTGNITVPTALGAEHFHGDTGTFQAKYINVITATKD